MRVSLTFIAFLLLSLSPLSAQLEVEFSFSNAANTNDSTDDFYEVDVMISTYNASPDFKLGSGQLYFNYNTAAFGTNVFTNGNIEFTYPNGTYVLGEHEKDFNFGDLYNNYVTNDNIPSRVSFSWQQNYAAGVFASENVTAVEAALFHVKIKYQDVGQAPGVTFESSSVFDDQTFTACGPFGAVPPLTSADCAGEPGTQITEDHFDNSGAALPPLPVEWMFFQAKSHQGEADLTWATATEVYTSHFEIQRSGDGRNWKNIGSENATGDSATEQHYAFTDRLPLDGISYYRLRQVDFDGAFEYSVIRSVSMEKKGGIELMVFPNPASGQLTVRNIDSDIPFRVFSPTGLMVENVYLTNGTSGTKRVLDVSALLPGLYFISFEDGRRTPFVKL